MNISDLQNEKPIKNRQKKARSVASSKRLIYRTALILCIVGFVTSAGSLVWYYAQEKASAKVFSEYAPNTNLDAIEVNVIPPSLTYVDVKGIMVWDRYVDAYLKNSDCIGWISIPGTVIDYPVAHSLEVPDYYLHKDLNKNYSFAGTIFADTDSNLETLSNNVVLYGHHMRNGTMFASLSKYDDEKYFNEHKEIVFDTIHGRQTYEVISAFRISANDDFKYAALLEAEGDAELQAWIDEILKRSYIKDTVASRNNKFLTLSTCDYTLSDGRFVVVAKQVSNSDDKAKKYISLNEYEHLQSEAQKKDKKRSDK